MRIPVDVVSAIPAAAGGRPKLRRGRLAHLGVLITSLAVCATVYGPQPLYPDASGPVLDAPLVTAAPIEWRVVKAPLPEGAVFAVGAPLPTSENPLAERCHLEELEATIAALGAPIIVSAPIEWRVVEAPMPENTVLVAGAPPVTIENPPAERCRPEESAAPLASTLSIDAELAPFWAGVDRLPTVASGTNSYGQSDSPVVYYDPNGNSFDAAIFINTAPAEISPSALFFDAGPLSETIPSPRIGNLDSLFNPSSSEVDPNADLYTTGFPDVNYPVLTDNFNQSGGSGTADPPSGAADPPSGADPVPEPSTLSVLVVGLAGILISRACVRATPDRGEIAG